MNYINDYRDLVKDIDSIYGHEDFSLHMRIVLDMYSDEFIFTAPNIIPMRVIITLKADEINESINVGFIDMFKILFNNNKLKDILEEANGLCPDLMEFLDFYKENKKYIDDNNFLNISHSLFISSIFVFPEFQGKGIGHFIIQEGFPYIANLTNIDYYLVKAEPLDCSEVENKKSLKRLFKFFKEHEFEPLINKTFKNKSFMKKRND